VVKFKFSYRWSSDEVYDVMKKIHALAFDIVCHSMQMRASSGKSHYLIQMD
jgi:hypothetical protein